MGVINTTSTPSSHGSGTRMGKAGTGAGSTGFFGDDRHDLFILSAISKFAKIFLGGNPSRANSRFLENPFPFERDAKINVPSRTMSFRLQVSKSSSPSLFEKKKDKTVILLLSVEKWSNVIQNCQVQIADIFMDFWILKISSHLFVFLSRYSEENKGWRRREIGGKLGKLGGFFIKFSSEISIGFEEAHWKVEGRGRVDE